MTFTKLTAISIGLIFLFSPLHANDTQMKKLLVLLESKDEYTSFSAAQSIVALGESARPAVPELIKRLSTFSGDSMTGDEFLKLISGMGTVAVPGLIKALSDPDIHTRRVACRVLAKMGPNAKDAIPSLIELMSEPGHDISHIAAYSLGEIGLPAMPYLLDILRSEDEGLRVLVTEMSVRRVPTELNLENQLLDIIQDPNEKPTTQKSAIDALGSLKLKNVETVVSVLVEKLGESKANIGSAATHTLGKIGPIAAPEVMKVFKSKNSVARAWSTYAIKLMHPPIKEAVPGLIGLLKDNEPTVRYGAKFALEQIGTPEALEAVKRNP